MDQYHSCTIAKLNDEALVSSFKNGNTDASGELYSRYYPKVFRKCLSFTKNPDDASDLAQDVFIKVIENLGAFKGQSRFSTWLYAITFNYCTDQNRKKKNKFFASVDTLNSVHHDSSSELDQLQNHDLKVEVADLALMTINSEDKELLILKYQLNKSINDLQELFNLSASAVKMRLKRAREKALVQYNKNLTLCPAA